MMTIVFDCRGVREIQRGKFDDLWSADLIVIRSAATPAVSCNKRGA
jgi:hypothetical protein